MKAGTSSAKHCLKFVTFTNASLTMTFLFLGGDVSWIEGSGPDVQSARTWTYTPTRISVLGSPLATRLTLCSWAEAEVVHATTPAAITDQRRGISWFLKADRNVDSI